MQGSPGAFSVTESGVAPAMTMDMHTDRDSGDTSTFLVQRRYGDFDGDKTKKKHGVIMCMYICIYVYTIYIYVYKL